MQQWPKKELEAELCGMQIGIIGFSDVQAKEIGSVVQSVGCGSIYLSKETSFLALDHYDLVLLSLSEDDPQSWITKLMETSQPWLLLENAEVVHWNASLHLLANEIVFQPYSPDELLFRIYRAIRRRSAGPRPTLGRRSPRVLVADDDPSILALLKSVLTGHGLECHFASNGRQALTMVRDLLPHLVVLDIGMLGMNGLEVLRSIRQDLGIKNTKVLLLTGARDLGSVETGLALGRTVT